MAMPKAMMTASDDRPESESIEANVEKLREIEGKLPDPVLPSELATKIFEGMENGLVVVEKETRLIKFVNPRAEFLFGYDRTELVDKPVHILVPEEVRAAHERYTTDYAEDPRDRPMSLGRLLEARHKSGRVIRVYIDLRTVSTSRGQFVLATVTRRAPEIADGPAAAHG